MAGEFPVSFGPSGMEVGAPEPAEIKHEASTERVSAGFERLDTMLGGGLFRGSSTLITGVPGTSKTIQRRAEFDHKRGELQAAEADTHARIKALQQDLERQRAELALYSRGNEVRIVSSSDRENELRRMRSADPAAAAATAAAPSLVERRVASGSGNFGNNGKKDQRNAP